jgi:hypothetical protein
MHKALAPAQALVPLPVASQNFLVSTGIENVNIFKTLP